MEKLKRGMVLLLVLCCAMGVVADVSATPFMTIKDYDGVTKRGRTAIKVRGKLAPFDINLGTDREVSDATLTLTHLKNRYSGLRPRSVYLVSGGTEYFLGTLGKSGRRKWQDQEFAIPDGVLGSPFEIRFDRPLGRFFLDKAIISGNYADDIPAPTAPVPEPATILLFGAGLASLAAWRKQKMSSEA